MQELIKQIALRVLGSRGSSFVRSAIDTTRVLTSRNPLVLVYQMGKVGSQSVYYSLLDVGYFPVVHFHYLNDLRRQKWHQYLWLQYGRWRSRSLKVITLVRDPVARNLSSFAHDFIAYFSSNMQDYPLKQLEKMYWTWDRHNDGINWFDEEFCKVLGVDIYAYPFEKEKGCSIFSYDGLEILAIKLELENGRREEVIKEFLSLDRFTLKAYNTSSDRPYKGNYQQFIQRIKLPRAYVDAQYSSKYARHFYTDDEIAGFRTRWVDD